MIALIALIATLLLGGLLKFAETQIKRSKNSVVVPVMAAVLCEVWGQRQFDMKMVEAGLSSILDVEVCSDAGCDDCREIRNAQLYKMEEDRLASRTWRERVKEDVVDKRYPRHLKRLPNQCDHYAYWCWHCVITGPVIERQENVFAPRIGSERAYK